MAPKMLQEAPRRLLDCSRWPRSFRRMLEMRNQDGSNMAQEGPKRAPKRSQERPESAPRGAQEAIPPALWATGGLTR
eukprot:9173148-Pyramimonas_sp.AAC.1